MLVSSMLVTRVFCAPVAHHIDHGTRHTHHGAMLLARSTHRKHSASSTQSDPSIMSPRHKLFPLMVVVIVVGCLLVLAGVAFLTRFLLRRKAQRTAPDPEPPMAEKQATLRHANSYLSNSTLYDDDYDDKPLAPPMRPVASSVSRGTQSRFGSSPSAFSCCFFDPERISDAGDAKYESSDDTHRKTLQSRASVRSSDTALTVYSLYAKVGKDDAAEVRENDLAAPCVTRGKPGWDIRATEEDGVEDVSLDMPSRPGRAL